MSNHIYPQTDEVDKLRLDKIIQKAKDLDIPIKKELFARLESSLTSVFGEGEKEVADFPKLLSKAFTDFEQHLATLKDQDAAEGFLHWNHLIFLKIFKKGNITSINNFLYDALDESKIWLADSKYSRNVLTHK